MDDRSSVDYPRLASEQLKLLSAGSLSTSPAQPTSPLDVLLPQQLVATKWVPQPRCCVNLAQNIGYEFVLVHFSSWLSSLSLFLSHLFFTSLPQIAARFVHSSWSTILLGIFSKHPLGIALPSKFSHAPHDPSQRYGLIWAFIKLKTFSQNCQLFCWKRRTAQHIILQSGRPVWLQRKDLLPSTYYSRSARAYCCPFMYF